VRGSSFTVLPSREISLRAGSTRHRPTRKAVLPMRSREALAKSLTSQVILKRSGTTRAAGRGAARHYRAIACEVLARDAWSPSTTGLEPPPNLPACPPLEKQNLSVTLILQSTVISLLSQLGETDPQARAQSVQLAHAVLL
jgi:hypothetical protein